MATKTEREKNRVKAKRTVSASRSKRFKETASGIQANRKARSGSAGKRNLKKGLGANLDKTGAKPKSKLRGGARDSIKEDTLRKMKNRKKPAPADPDMNKNVRGPRNDAKNNVKKLSGANVKAQNALRAKQGQPPITKKQLARGIAGLSHKGTKAPESKVSPAKHASNVKFLESHGQATGKSKVTNPSPNTRNRHSTPSAKRADPKVPKGNVALPRKKGERLVSVPRSAFSTPPKSAIVQFNDKAKAFSKPPVIKRDAFTHSQEVKKSAITQFNDQAFKKTSPTRKIVRAVKNKVGGKGGKAKTALKAAATYGAALAAGYKGTEAAYKRKKANEKKK